MVWGLFGPSSIRPPFVAWVQISLKLYTISYFHVWNDIPMKSVKVIFRWRMGNRCVHRAQTALLHNAKKKKKVFLICYPLKNQLFLNFCYWPRIAQSQANITLLDLREMWGRYFLFSSLHSFVLFEFFSIVFFLQFIKILIIIFKSLYSIYLAKIVVHSLLSC